MKKTLSVIIAILMLVSAVPTAFAAETETVIIYTNDVHCAIDDYPVIAAYKTELIAQGKNVIVVDAGDAIQGEIIGAITEGEAVVDIMNTIGYDYAIPGNHEFDYGVEVFLDLAQNKAKYEYLSSNFYDLTSVESVFAPYAIEDIGDYQIAFVGISTPETVSKSNPDYFKNEDGNFIYGFPVYPGGMTNEILYEHVQNSIDAAVGKGADIVVALGHMGITETTEGWKSIDVIANTNGIDYFIDAHSEEVIENDVYKNKDNEDVVLTSTGTKLAYFGVMTISGGNADFELINPDDVEIETMSESAKTAYDNVKAKVDGYYEDIAYLFENIGTSEVELHTRDEDFSWAVRERETNAGDFVADAYRAVTGADVAIANGGGIREKIGVGNVSRKMLMDMNPFGNSMCVVEVTGQQLVDVLEHGARACPESLGGFFQVSGVTFEIHTYRESPVICDQLDNFIGINEEMERRVQNVFVGDEPVDLGEKYTLAGSTYVILSGGDGLSMLEGSTVVQQEGLPCDNGMLIEYFTEHLDGVISADVYGNPEGDGRITIVESSFEAPECDYEMEYGETKTVTVGSGEEIVVKFVPEKSGKYIFRTESEWVDTCASMVDSNGNDICTEYEDDTIESNDFRLLCELEAGEEYYLYVSAYSDNSETFDLVIDCGHNFEDESCIVCGKVCDHTEDDFLGFCVCGKIFLGKEIADGDELDVETESDSDYVWFRFIPEESGLYSFKSALGERDPDCDLYDSEGEWLAGSTDVNGTDFDLIHYFEAGETYYFETHNCMGSGTFSVSLNRVKHVADDGSEHTDIEFVEETYSNCTEAGHTEGLYCNECEEFISGNEEKELDKDYHIDENFDETCDLCGKENIWENDCGHICHSENFFLKVIWRILNFFNKLFGLSPDCECGEAHYFYIDYDV
ncbi:MAG: bifunctional metallophosphatase/5'-nucleotidase [Clostridia bacterium]|nr:bifunctional metallophosphatase/5'-nucleotidase [Clostridia bacterium]